MQTRAAVVEGQGQPFTMAEVELDEPRDDEVLVRMVATGLCHTDITMGHFLPAEMFPNVFGHEGAGVVETVGARVKGLEPGDHVVMSFRSCRDCAKCRAGQVGYCDQTLLLNYMGMRMDGEHLAAARRQPGLRQLLRTVQPGRARAGLRRQLRQGRPGARPEPPGAVRLRVPDRRRHGPQRDQARDGREPGRVRRGCGRARGDRRSGGRGRRVGHRG